MRALLVVALLVSRASAGVESDPTRAWTAAQANLPASTTVVFGVNVDAAMASSLAIFAPPLAMSLGVNNAFDRMKTTCKIDPAKAIDAMVIVEGAKPDVGAYYFAVDGVDEKSLNECLTKLELSGKVVTAWIGSDILVIPAKPTDAAMLKQFTSGKGGLAKTALGKLVAKTNTNAALWAASVKSRAVQGKTMKAGYGGFVLEKGTLTANVAMTFGSATEAKAVAKLANDQVIALLASGQLDAIVMEMLNKVTITTKASDVLIAGSIPDNQLMSLISALSR